MYNCSQWELRVQRTSGTCSFSACDEAASVVTNRFNGDMRDTLKLLLRAEARAGLNALHSMVGVG